MCLSYKRKTRGRKVSQMVKLCTTLRYLLPLIKRIRCYTFSYQYFVHQPLAHISARIQLGILRISYWPDIFWPGFDLFNKACFISLRLWHLTFLLQSYSILWNYDLNFVEAIQYYNANFGQISIVPLHSLWGMGRHHLRKQSCHHHNCFCKPHSIFFFTNTRPSFLKRSKF